MATNNQPLITMGLIWQVIDPVAPRYTALLGSEVVPLLLTGEGAREEVRLQPKHPKVRYLRVGGMNLMSLWFPHL